MNPSPILVQDAGDEKPCTSGHGVVVAAAAAVAPEWCSKKITGLIKVYISSLFCITKHYILL